MRETATRYEVVFAGPTQATIEAIRAASAKTLVLWSFYSPDAAALADELEKIKVAARVPSMSPVGCMPPPSRCRLWTPAGTSPPSVRARRPCGSSWTPAVTRPAFPAWPTATAMVTWSRPD